MEHLLAGDILLFEKDLPAVESFLQHLVPSNALVIVHSKAFQGSTRLKETWYGTDYNLGQRSSYCPLCCDCSRPALIQWI